MAQELVGPAFYSYDLTVETKINIDELIYILSPMDLPLLSGVGADGVPIMPRTPVDNTEFYWLEESVPLPRGTLNGGINNSTTSVTVATGDAVKFAVGDGIRIDDEIMVVTGVNTSTEVLTVVRGSSGDTGTTAASHLDGAEVVGLGTILIEGSIGSANFQGRDKYSNYTQIWSKKLTVSRTEQRIPKYGVPNELNKQMLNAMQHLNLGIEQSALYGVKHVRTSDNRRQTGGMLQYITSNVDSASQWLTIEAIEDQQQAAYDRGGMFEIVMARPINFQALNNIAGNERVQTVTVEDSRRGRRRATTVMTEFGEVTLVRNRWARKEHAFCYSRDNFIFRQFQPLTTEKLAKTDDTDSYMMVCEGGFQVKGQDHMAKFTALDATAALPGSGLV
jgi:hypothetical protein